MKRVQFRLVCFVLGFLVISFAAPRPAHAQNFIKKLGNAVGVKTIEKDGTSAKANDDDPKVGKDTKVADSDANAVPTPERNQPAKFSVMTSSDAVCKSVKKYFVANNIELKSADCDAGQITTSVVNNSEWKSMGNVSRRMVVNFVDVGQGTEVRVRAMKMSHSFWSTNGDRQTSDTKTEDVDAKESVRLATALRDHMSSAAGGQTASKQ